MHAITINATPESVWPWLVQMGSGRAGWYSYDWVDNDGRPSASEIVPSLQHVVSGDIMPALPGEKRSFIIAAVEPAHNLILVVPAESGRLVVTWDFFLEPLALGRTRLLVRGRVNAQWPAGAMATASARRRPIERVYALLVDILGVAETCQKKPVHDLGQPHWPGSPATIRQRIWFRFTDVAIDDMLKSDSLTYADLARMAQDEATGEGASLLRGIFGISDTTGILTTWIADTERDGDLEAKGALGELRSVVLARLGLALPDDAGHTRMRSITAIYLLANELRSDLGQSGRLKDQAASALKNIPIPTTADQQKTMREVAMRLRERHAAAYAKLADGIEKELGLSAESVMGSALSAIDTFRFEEIALAAACLNLIADGKFAEAGSLLGSRGDSFWVNLDVDRKTVCGLMVDLGLVAERLCNHSKSQRQCSPMGQSLCVHQR